MGTPSGDSFAGPRARNLAKSLLMPALAARFVRADRGPEFRPVVAAQALSWVGDLALNGSSRGRFLLGLSSFLAAHVAYVSAYRRRSSVGLLDTTGRRRLMAGGAGASLAMALAAGRQDRAAAVPVAAYGVTLTTMVAAAAAVDPDRGRNRILAGASLFLLSDTLIGVGRFVMAEESPGYQAAVLGTYGAAQLLICEGLVR
ncbi:lysoplasmalogenase [Nocardioides sp.]|uniref:lysoplasmalogenase n=1 Tax=Nocardioides sp. TaxID=35761 RepID=UPI002ED09C28